MQGENTLRKILGCIIANILSAEYNEWMAYYMKHELKNNYLYNKCTQAHKAEQLVINKLKLADPNVRKEVEQIKDKYCDLIFDIMALEEKDQNRIISLIRKIKKENNG